MLVISHGIEKFAELVDIRPVVAAGIEGDLFPRNQQKGGIRPVVLERFAQVGQRLLEAELFAILVRIC